MSITTKIMLIGCGHHAKRIYIPSLIKLRQVRSVELSLIVDLKSREKDIAKYLSDKSISPETILIDESNSSSQEIPQSLLDEMDTEVDRLGIGAVVISTDPLYHKAYALWALKKGLHILMDKPITTRINVVNDVDQARGIYDDYVEILDAYNSLQNKKETIFSITTQRRYEGGFTKVCNLVKEVADEFNMPVTSIQAMHADGVWIFPDEVVEQDSHGYNLGNGKCSHSGYHIFDIVGKIYKAGLRDGKKPTKIQTVSSFVRPLGLLEQYSQKDYRNLFGKKYDNRARRDEKDLAERIVDYGENDAFSIIKMMKGDTNICNISINLLHNSFSRRSSMVPNEDLYKSNGRVKHQYFSIQQGPFQCIQIHNYQSKSNHDSSIKDEHKVGGNNHFDINVFRNSDLFEKKVPAFQTFSVNDQTIVDTEKLHNESAKELVVLEFIRFIQGEVKKSNLISNIDAHELSVQLMASIYESSALMKKGSSPVSEFKLNL